MEVPAQNQNSNNWEWMKNKLSVIWSSQKFCGLCLENTIRNLCSVDMELVINKQTFSRCLRDIINYVFNDDVENLMSSLFICDACIEKVIQSYLFIHNTKQLFRIINNCVNDINSKVIDVNYQLNNSLNCENANVMIVVESDIDLYKTVIDTKMTEIVPTAFPIAMKQEPEIVIAKVESLIQTAANQKDKENFLYDKPIIKREDTPNIILKEGHLEIQPLNAPRNLKPRYNTYACANCPEIFTIYRSLKEHEKAKHKTSVFCCNLCNKMYNTRQYLNLHYKTHEKAKCKFCQVILPENELMEHLRANHLNLVFPCKFCDLVYYTYDSLTTHFNISHLVNNKNLKSQCRMCLKKIEDGDKKHKCKFACSECFVMPCVHYKYLMSYREQILNHANKIKCMDCDYVTRRKEHLISHVNREHLDHHPFTCADCDQQFYTKLSLRTHIVQFHQEFNCKYCDSQYKDNDSLVIHKNVCKSIIRVFSCNQCAASFDVQEELTIHEYLRHSETVHACKLCKSRFLTVLELEEHHARVHGGIQWKKRRKHIECSLCDIFFNNIKELVQHEKIHTQNEWYPCKKCPKKFKTLIKLYTHGQRHYTDRIKCERCNKNVSASFFAQHNVRCPSLKESVLKHVCEICGKAFQRESLLIFHQKVHLEPAPCPHCNKLIKPSSLKRHIEQSHSEILPRGEKQRRKLILRIECQICGHKVKRKADLEAHTNRYHLKIKPYVCHICSKDFCGRLRLKEHMATHSNDNNCFCTVCGKKFANRVCLKMHFRMHTGELPYSCDLCGQKFRSSSMMKTHRLKKHLDKTVGCPLCDSMFYMVRDMRHHFRKVHWKFKDRSFNVREVEELGEEFYHLFDDQRLPKMDV